MGDLFTRQRELVRQYPENELARFSLGRALFDAGDFAGAREQLEVALRRKPDWMVVQILLGKCDLAQGSADAARSAFERALQLARQQHHEGPEAELLDLLSGLNPEAAHLGSEKLPE
jgi:Tfp pilus assembly protein PilF